MVDCRPTFPSTTRASPEPSLSDLPRALAAAISDRYRIERELGRGGMATVYLADDLKHGRKVALKVMHPEMAARIGPDRFLREIEIVARLSHPHILPLFDSGAEAGQFYYVMPYVTGESLRVRIERERHLPMEDALRLAREIAGALGHAHAQGLVHRDVKPENVLLSDGIALVADFGIARVTSPDSGRDTQVSTQAVTSLGLTLGTPLYMAPEQATGEGTLDGRADQYSLACVLYELLTGQPPFVAPSAAALLLKHAKDPVPPLRGTRPDLPEALERALEKALAKAPGDRHASMARFAEALALAATGARTPTPAPERKASVVPTNLPQQRTSFVGRTRELAECARLMGETRLLTLTGVGGCGKTRLGLRLAESLLESHPDGVYWVDLAPMTEAARFVQTLASTLNVQEEVGRTLLESVAADLASKRVLLVLDNCEHLLSVTGETVDALLGATTQLRIVLTSREGLGVPGEHVFALRSLSVPSAAQQNDLHAIEECEAVKLFVDRARQAVPNFVLAEAAAPAVAEICRRLDGMPLAIELAAARIKMLTVEQVRARLDDRFRLLTGGSKALPRHQTLRATIQWSYDQLDEDEQGAFRAMAVFAGGWTLPDAVAVAGEDADEFEVLDLLTRLADKSLVVVDREGGAGEARYSMLETVRQFALELLNQSPERDAVRDRHLDRFIAFAEEFERLRTGGAAVAFGPLMDRELENVLAAHVWCGEARDGALRDLRLVKGLRRYWVDRGLLDLGKRIFNEALERASGLRDTREYSHLLAGLSDVYYFRGEYAESASAGREALAIGRALGDRATVLSALDAASCAVYALGEADEARVLCEEFVELAREQGESRWLMGSLTYLSEIRRASGDLAGALELYDELLPKSRDASAASLSITYSNMSMIHTALGNARELMTTLLRAGDCAEAAASRRISTAFLETAASAAEFFGRPELAARFYGASEQQMARSGAQREPADAAFHLPIQERLKAALGAGEYARLQAAGREPSLEAVFAEALAWARSLEAGR